MNRRTVLGTIGGVGIASLSGCLGTLGLDAHEASPFGVDEATRTDAGYAQTSVERLGIEEEVDLQLWSESITVTNWVTEHEKSVSVGPLFNQRAAVFVVLSTPQISVAGRQVNPVEDMSADELVELLADNYDEIDDVERRGSEEVTILGESTTHTTFDAQASFSGQSLGVNLHVTEAVATDDDDLVVAVGVYPEELESGERDNVVALMEAIVEEVDEDESETPDDAGGDSSNDGDSDDEDDEDEDDGILGTFL